MWSTKDRKNRKKNRFDLNESYRFNQLNDSKLLKLQNNKAECKTKLSIPNLIGFSQYKYTINTYIHIPFKDIPCLF